MMVRLGVFFLSQTCEDVQEEGSRVLPVRVLILSYPAPATPFPALATSVTRRPEPTHNYSGYFYWRSHDDDFLRF